MDTKFSRTELLFGTASMDKLKKSKVLIFGVGGVGGYVVEALARSGVGTIDLVDHDTISESNINRQIIATTKTIGKLKVDVAKERILDINPNCLVSTFPIFFQKETKAQLEFSKYDYIVDAIDTISGKKEIILAAKEANVPVISSMGAGNKLDPTRFRVADIFKTSVDPLARVMRGICKQNNIKHLKVVFSDETPIHVEVKEELPEGKKSIPGSCAFVPSAAGLVLASEVIKDLIS